MKKIIFLILSIFAFQQIFACDICGCSSGNYFLGPIPQFSKRFIGVRYSFISYKTVLKTDISQFSKDFYQTTELWGGYKIKNIFQVLVFIPFNINRSTTDDGKKANNGFGDFTIFGNYNLFVKKSLNENKNDINQQLWIGLGVKLPTGEFALDNNELVSSSNSQVGTGSFDFLINAFHYIKWDNLGLTSNISYKINQSSSGFKFGNRLTTSVFTFHSFYLSKYTLSPNMGLEYENLDPNTYNKIKINDTGGDALLGIVGFESRFDNLTIGLNAKLPIAVKLSNGQTKINVRGMAHVAYSF